MGCPPSYEEQQSFNTDREQDSELEAIQLQRKKIVRTREVCEQLSFYFNAEILGQKLFQEFSEIKNLVREEVMVVSNYDPNDQKHLQLAKENRSRLHSIRLREEIELCILNCAFMKVWPAIKQEEAAGLKEQFSLIRSEHLQHRLEDRDVVLKSLNAQKNRLEMEQLKTDRAELLHRYESVKAISLPEVIREKDPEQYKALVQIKTEQLSEMENLISQIDQTQKELEKINAEIKRISSIPEEELLTNRMVF